MIDLKGKKALITGASRGIGAAIAIELAKQGADIIINYHQSKIEADEVSHQIAETGAKSLLIQADVGKLTDVNRMFAQIEKEWDTIDILVNNAGVENRKSSLEMDETDYEWIMNTNLKGAFFCAQNALKGMLTQGWGRIINISSVAGMIADGNMIAYNTAKAAVWMMTKSIGLHCARSGYDIRCNSVHPVFTRTPIIDPLIAFGGGGEEGEKRLVQQIPWKRLAEPEDVGYCVLYLASDESRYVTASEFKIDGGITAQ